MRVRSGAKRLARLAVLLCMLQARAALAERAARSQPACTEHTASHPPAHALQGVLKSSLSDGIPSSRATGRLS